MTKKIRVPRTKADYIESLKSAFMAGCEWGYGVDVSADPQLQAEVGARNWVGEITLDEASELKERIIEENRPKYEY